jgi:hypothetical protein
MITNNVLYNKVFTGEIPPVIINQYTASLTENNIQFNEVPLIKWRDIALKHLPSNAKLSTVECELKLEYLHVDYLIPSRVVVPSSAIPNMERRESVLNKQVKTLEFKNKYNANTNYAFEVRLIRQYDPNYTLGGQLSYSNSLNYPVSIGYPIAELIYNNRLPGFMDLIPYLIKNGTLIFADIKQELKVQILPKLSVNDVLIFGGGYSGSVTFELLEPSLVITKSEVVTLTGITPSMILDNNSNRYGFYLCNNSTVNVYYNFGDQPSANSGKLILKPSETLILEDKKLTLNNSTIDPGDNRFMLGSKLWVRSSVTSGINQVSIEEISYP